MLVKKQLWRWSETDLACHGLCRHGVSLCISLKPAKADQHTASAPTLKGSIRAKYKARFDQLRAPRCIWFASAALNTALFGRLQPHLPPGCLGGALYGLNRRWRIYRYRPGQQFMPHLDDAYDSSYLDASGRVAVDGSKRSLLSVLIYLTEGMDGGETRFWVPDTILESFNFVGVRPVCGDALVFYHGSHPQSPIHEGCLVTTGVKYVLRGDVLYERGVVSDEESVEFKVRARRWQNIYGGRLKWQHLGRQSWTDRGKDETDFLKQALGNS